MSKNVARKLFRFGVGTEKFTRRNEIFLVPFFPKSGLSFFRKMVRNFVSSILLSFGRFRGREEDLYSLLWILSVSIIGFSFFYIVFYINKKCYLCGRYSYVWS
ncbi:inner membrane protein unknown function [Porphyromonas gingivalis ATCC 33277]|uniref:Uncharacterized protein n=1 Tax=Porphyromonas gingivalis (strain ATCC 33277 / DSM 20709 / CIP 103683 / JCM 12257 / NCTC 11834 / 2561) TaxID=431947 RepID=B2RLC3_PORG3|nr:hypothetical protein EG14_10480 [Porphyromonas gingivalis]AUR50645.1 inner membrane protein unknown function [Porphyromonas gingivalis ATCC 33277]BAG34168.1 conserved hypothetical protein [Porphyromonas gingivalis ATCC 33277]HBW77798.1 hypothetical protein [Porphyromonas gingivalis]